MKSERLTKRLGKICVAKGFRWKWFMSSSKIVVQFEELHLSCCTWRFFHEGLARQFFSSHFKPKTDLDEKALEPISFQSTKLGEYLVQKSLALNFIDLFIEFVSTFPIGSLSPSTSTGLHSRSGALIFSLMSSII